MPLQIQIQASEISKCLTFSDTDTMGAYNPVTTLQGNFPLATWEDCVSADPRQTFEYSLSTGQLINSDNGLCLTPLPISAGFHPNLDSCDIWNSDSSDLSGAGTYLFAVDCIASGNIDASSVYQQYTYDSNAQTLSSNCNHGLNLGIVGDDNSGYSAFLTGSSNTFPSAQVASGYDVPLVNYISISQSKNDAVIDILSEFLTQEQAQKVVQHGCWCSKISGFNPEYAGQQIDELDSLCKDWSYLRRCNGMVGGSCPHLMPQEESYLIDRTTGGNVFSCDSPSNDNDDCLKDTCLIDATMAVAIYDYLQANPDWDLDLVNSDQCAKIVFEGSSENSHNQDPNFSQGGGERVCVGTAPDLEIELL